MIHHDLVVTLDPANHRLKVRDRIRIPGAFVSAPLTVSLNAELNVQAVSGGLRLLPVRSRVPGSDSGMDRDDHDPASRVPINLYRVEGAMPGQELTAELDYEGVINFAVRQSGGEYARAFSQSPGLIEPRGVYLAGSTNWVPRVGISDDPYARGRAACGLEIGQSGELSSGETPGSPAGASERWSVATPTEEVHLIAAPFTEYSGMQAREKAFASRKPDQALAIVTSMRRRNTSRCIAASLGPYPYSKFALRRTWETGYGMPSFTPWASAGHQVSVHPAFFVPA